MRDACEWWPPKKRAAYENEYHAEAEVLVGADGQWRLCKSCAELPEFNRFKSRKIIGHKTTQQPEGERD